MEPEDYRQFRESKIQLFSRIKPKNIFPGEWESIYTGEGIEFAAIRPLEPGDDLRDLDLHTLVQSGEEEIIERVVERQLRVFVWADFSGSTQRFDEMFFPQKPEIKDVAIGLLLFSASNAYSPVGLYAFNKELTKFFPARSGERRCWEILDWVIDQQYQGSVAPADIPGAVSFLLQRAFPQSLVFFVSDFEDRAFEGDFTELLRPAAKKFDLVAVVIRDPLEKEVSLARPVTIAVTNSEGGRSAEIYLTPKKLRDIQGISARHLSHLERGFRAIGVEHVVLDSPCVEDCHRVFSEFFEGRKRVRV
jgi:uncharacterized protein (DUF58 family)